MSERANQGGGASGQSIVTADAVRKTDDIRLAAALLAMGVAPLFHKVGMTISKPNRPGNWTEFFFEPKTRDGKWSTADLMRCWAGGNEWIERNPDHPFAYVMAAMANHRDLIAHFKSDQEFVFLTKGRSVAMLPSNASAGLEARILGKW